MTWPKPATAQVTVPRPTSGLAARKTRDALAQQNEAAPAGPAARAGTLPVRLAVGDPAVAKGARTPGVDAPELTAKVSVHDQDAARKAGVRGLLLSVQRTDSGGGTAPLSVELDYRSFAQAYGGAWGSRLRFTALPACALTTPARPECRAGAPVPSANDAAEGTLTGTVAARSAGSASDSVVLAATAGPSGPTGTYKATSLSPTGSWSGGGSAGDFSWSYPIEIPASLGGPGPSVALGYSSGSVDGRTLATSQQSSWVGDGWDMGDNFIERSYVPCAEDRKPNSGFNNPTTHPTGDLCQGPPMVTLSLNGSSTSLVLDDTSKKWIPANEDGSKVEIRTDTENGDNENQYWVVTNTEGIEFHFGRNRLPGWTTGKPVTNSAFTVPVYGNHPNEDCHAATFAASVCDQAYRWNLDYVVDPRGNALTYWYAKERNHYGSNVTTTGTTTARGYDRGGWLTRAAYGLRSDALFAPAPAEVVFGVTERCIVVPGVFDCAESKLTSTAPYDVTKRWPDVPADQLCAAGETCTNRTSPTFFTRKRLETITTQVLKNGVPTPVDTWTLEQDFLPTGDGAVAGEYPLWLKSITHTGRNGGELALPPVTFGGIQLDNRVDNDDDGDPPYKRWRIETIQTETGARTVVKYAPTECSSVPGSVKLPASPAENTLRCYPVIKETNDPTDPTGTKKLYKTDWFHKHRVDQVRDEDINGTSPARETNYQYVGTPAWAYDDTSELTNEPARTWSVHRGYAKVRTLVGVAPDKRSQTDTLFFRGLDGDRKADGTRRSVKVTDSEGGQVADHPLLAGQVRETLYYDGEGGALHSATVNTPWFRGPTATRNRAATGAAPLEAWVQGLGSTTSRSILSDNRGQRRTAVEHEYDATGRVTQTTSRGDIDNPDDDSCVRYEYLDDTAKWFRSQRTRTESLAKACDDATLTRPGDVISDAKVTYDAVGNVVGTASLKGYSGSTPQYEPGGSSTFDEYGRPTSLTDVYGKTTRMAYTPASGAVVTKTVTTNPLDHTATTEVDPGRGLPVAQIDANGRKSVMQYDPLGRMTKVWSPDRDSLTTTPDAEFSYTVGRNAPVVITNKRLLENGTYRVSYDFYDGALRLRQTQNPASGGGRVVTDTFYDSLGRVWKENAGYYNSASDPVPSMFPAVDNGVPSSTVTTYDGMSRPTATIARKFGLETWRTTTTYGGDWTAVDPPAGETPTMALMDALGRKTELRQFKGDGPSGDYDRIAYHYNRKGQLEKVVDQVGNEWTRTYDIRGRITSSTDPDKGTASVVYDKGDRVVSMTDGRTPAQTIAMAYDDLGRVTATHAESLAGPKLTSQTYDTLPGALGMPVASTRYVDGDAYTQAVTAYDTEYRPKGTSITIPASETGLAGTYTFSSTYTARTGLPYTTTHPVVGGLPSERVSIGYNALDAITTMSVAGKTFVAGTEYTSLGDVVRTRVDSAGKQLISSYVFDEQTRRVTRATHHQETGTVDTTQLSDVTTAYDAVGNVTRITEKTGDNPTPATTDVQCFTYDYLRRMSDAWTSTDDCASRPGSAGPGTAPQVGGPDPYWHSYTFDAVGNRRTEIKHDTAGDPAKDITRTYTYATGLPTKSRLSKVTTTGPQGSREELYGYDEVGNTNSRTIQGNTQSLQWDIEGHLQKVTAGQNETAFVYDAGGNRLIKREPSGTTLYLPGTELKVDKDGKLLKTTRFYGHPAGPAMVKVAQGGTITTSYMLSDRNGTATTSVDAATKAVTRRKFTPFGEERGQAPSMWPSEKGYVGGTKDESTGLTHLGAREYDPTLGRFISVDPQMDIAESQTMNPYAYGNNSPITFADPTGRAFCGDDDCKSRIETQGKSSDQVGSPAKKGPTTTSEPPTPPSTTTSEDDVRRATLIKQKSKADIILEIALEVAKDMSGFNDIKDCIGGDLWACGSIALDAAMPFAGKAKKAFKALKTAWKMYHRWEDEVRWATTTLRRADDDAKAMAKYADDMAAWKKEADAAKAAAKKADEAAADAAKKADGSGGDVPSCPVRNSFTPETKVLLADGSTKAIKDLKPGDKVLATDEKTGETAAKDVSATIVGEGEKHLVKITVDTDGTKGDRTAPITATDGHPFWVPALRKWIDAKDLKPGQWLRTSAGTHVQITAVRAWTQPASVRNLTVADFHTYYVLAGAAAVLVHNCQSGENGGWYGGLTRNGSGAGKEVNHMPAKAPLKKSTGISKHSGPAIRMDAADHRALYSTGYGLPTQAWHMRQKELLDAGDLRGAIQMDVDDIRARFGSKYDEAIIEMWMSLSSNKAVQAWARRIQGI
ncbi:polymorphic toxin-type HINT domain-containing protein [Streptomyces sp. NPDC059071]|uniref:polymorphic toxin-type HINT domain-containing protein n=1 Tax=Streptomyces sp. NPDC059071 TaxID=3346714 RepID=UPI003699E01D